MVEKNHVNDLISRYPVLDGCRSDIKAAVAALLDTYQSGGKILLIGDGGSVTDCDHVSAELLGGLLLKRTPSSEELVSLSIAIGEKNASKLQRGIPAIPLNSLNGALGTYRNDISDGMVYAQSVYAMGRRGDTLICISQAPPSDRICLAAKCARAIGITALALTGRDGGALADAVDVAIRVPEIEPLRVRELQVPVYNAICAELERVLF